MEMKEVKVRVIDHETYPGNITSKFLTRKECKMIYPNREAIKLVYQFKHKIESMIPEKQAKFLNRKYGAVIEIIGREPIKLSPSDKKKHDVDDMKRPQLVRLAARLHIEGAMKMKNPDLIDAIKRSLFEGNEPVSEEEYDKARGK